jgi:hypothetical protein
MIEMQVKLVSGATTKHLVIEERPLTTPELATVPTPELEPTPPELVPIISSPDESSVVHDNDDPEEEDLTTASTITTATTTITTKTTLENSNITKIDETKTREPLQLTVSFIVHNVGVSLITQEPKELVYMHIDSMSFKLIDTHSSQTMLVRIGKVQIDNQLQMQSPFPVFVHLLSTANGGPTSLLKARLVRRKHQAVAWYFDSAVVSLGSVAMTFDDNLLDAIAEFIQCLTAQLSRRSSIQEAQLAARKRQRDYEHRLLDQQQRLGTLAQSFFGISEHSITSNSTELEQSFARIKHLQRRHNQQLVLGSKSIGPNAETRTARNQAAITAARVATRHANKHNNDDLNNTHHDNDHDNHDNHDNGDNDEYDEYDEYDDLSPPPPMVYVCFLHLEPMILQITFKSVTRAGYTTNKLLKMGRIIPNIDHAPLPLNGLAIMHCLASSNDLVTRIAQHYRAQLVRRWHHLLGAADFLGSPISLVSHLGIGVYDFFHEPARGLVTGPMEFAVGLAKGSSSLVKHSVHGIFNSVSKITGTLGNGVAALSFDYQYQRRRDLEAEPRHVAEGLVQGLSGLGRGIYDGVTGLVQQPMVHSRQSASAFGGALTGMLLGATGIVTKPLAGVADLVTKTGAGIKNTLLQPDYHQYSRLRYPRAIASTGAIERYDAAKAIAQYILHNIAEADRILPGESMLRTYLLRQQRLLLLTQHKILVVRVPTPSSPAIDRADWQASLLNIASVRLYTTHVALVFTHPIARVSQPLAVDASAEPLHETHVHIMPSTPAPSISPPGPVHQTLVASTTDSTSSTATSTTPPPPPITTVRTSPTTSNHHIVDIYPLQKDASVALEQSYTMLANDIQAIIDSQ